MDASLDARKGVAGGYKANIFLRYQRRMIRRTAERDSVPPGHERAAERHKGRDVSPRAEAGDKHVQRCVWSACRVYHAATRRVGYVAGMPMPVMDCETPLVLDALRGTFPAADMRYLHAPVGIGGPSGTSAPPPAAKIVYGTNLANHLETENFSINWANGDGSVEIAEAAGIALELGWSRLIDDLGWQAPVSSDEYLLWVVLDASLGGTGFTTQYETDEFPGGYPVVYLNSGSADNPNFFHALAQHEFHHAIQYGYRREYSSGPDEAWYWEASANWAPYLVDQDSTAFDYTSAWYADVSELKYSSTEGSHQYGMFVLNSYLDEVVGAGTLLGIWSASGDGDEWLDVIETGTGQKREEVWGKFASNYGRRMLANSDEWARVQTTRAEQGAPGTAGELGTVYYQLESGQERWLSLNMIEGEAVLSGAFGVGGEGVIAGGETFAVTPTSSGGATWHLVVGDIPVDTAEDTGTADTAGLTGDSGVDTDPVDTSDGPHGCACQLNGLGPIGGLSVLAPVLLAAIRRRPSDTKPI